MCSKESNNCGLHSTLIVFTKSPCQNDFLLNLKSEMKAGDLAVIRTTESSPRDDTKVKLRSCTFPKSAWNRRSREVYFDFLGNIVVVLHIP